MFFIFGTKQYDAAHKGYKIAPCNHCDAPRTIVEWSWNQWLHVFYIPLLPMGKAGSWQCAACGLEPKEKKATSIVVKLVLLLMLLLFAPIPIIGGFEAMEPWIYWPLMALIAWFFWLVIKSMVTHRKTMKKFAQENMLPLLSKEACELCEGKLESNKNVLQCQDCNCFAYE